MDLGRELLNFSYREKKTAWKDIFPNVKMKEVQDDFAALNTGTVHETILNTASQLWDGGYDAFLAKYGFFEKEYSAFSGHCHQCTPILGAVLHSFGMDVAYLECMRVREHVSQTGKVEQVPPQEEPDPARLEEFCSIGRIPYCCLEIQVNGMPYYVTGKHIKPEAGKPVALLSPKCYVPFVGVFRHQHDTAKSGMYLQQVMPKKNPDGIDFTKQVIWTKQTMKDPAPEYFATFLRMTF